ncbi:hypothetical protein FA13DRAFT_1715933 [Coprinellus micaceus]|uniref:Uncharacterized protein n=1 Tax=Coprinellus micaceus TaxID=71717 RepID=A0A4Y7SLI9_COPMI|nr:hypothetical protein FA13DRAFT_1715933 [Coprinellus micaceus]
MYLNIASSRQSDVVKVMRDVGSVPFQLQPSRHATGLPSKSRAQVKQDTWPGDSVRAASGRNAVQEKGYHRDGEQEIPASHLQVLLVHGSVRSQVTCQEKERVQGVVIHGKGLEMAGWQAWIFNERSLSTPWPRAVKGRRGTPKDTKHQHRYASQASNRATLFDVPLNSALNRRRVKTEIMALGLAVDTVLNEGSIAKVRQWGPITCFGIITGGVLECTYRGGGVLKLPVMGAMTGSRLLEFALKLLYRKVEYIDISPATE